MSKSKFYSKSLTLLLSLLKMINDGRTTTEIAKVLHLSKQRLSYHINKAVNSGYVTEVCRDTFKAYELTQPGKNFLAMYQNNKVGQQTTSMCRAENVRFKAPVYKMPFESKR